MLLHLLILHVFLQVEKGQLNIKDPFTQQLARWWFQKKIFSPLFGEDEPILTSIFFRWVGSTTNQLNLFEKKLEPTPSPIKPYPPKTNILYLEVQDT